MPSAVYVPVSVGEGYFTDWANPLPASDPGVAGQIWVDAAGYLRISSGPVTFDFSLAQNSALLTLLFDEVL